MKEQYSKVCKKILENYKQYLTKKEILALQKILKLDKNDNLNIIIFIHKLIDRIWQMTLTNPINFKNGKPFKFLIANYIPNEDNINNIKTKTKNISLKLMDEENIINSYSGINGIIVEIDFANSLSEPLLPIDFNDKKSLLVKSNLIVKGIYHISLGLGIYDASEEITNYYSEISHIPIVNINKPIYNYIKTNTILDESDIEDLTSILITYYLIDCKKNILLKDNLNKKYKNSIYQKYIEYFNHIINLEEFIDFTYKLLDNDLLLAQVDKIM